MFGEPVCFRFDLRMPDQPAGAGERERDVQEWTERRQFRRVALIEPDQRRSPRAAILIGADRRRTHRGQGQAGDVFNTNGAARPKLAAGGDDGVPVHLGILFGPAGLQRKVRGIERHLRFCE